MSVHGYGERQILLNDPYLHPPLRLVQEGEDTLGDFGETPDFSERTKTTEQELVSLGVALERQHDRCRASCRVASGRGCCRVWHIHDASGRQTVVRSAGPAPETPRKESHSCSREGTLDWRMSAKRQ